MEYKSLEEMLHQLRVEKGYLYEDVATKVNIPRVTAMEVKKWEKGLAYPDLDTIYKLGEIYKADPTIILNYKQEELKKGLDSIHIRCIKWISFFLNISLSFAKWISYSLLFIFLLIALSLFRR